MNELTELLQRWASVAPDECVSQDNGDFTVKIYGNLNIDPSDIDKWLEWEIQGAVQQAIEARGWDWQLFKGTYEGNHKHEDGTVFWEGVVTVGKMDAFKFLGDVQSIYSPAHALLAAYVQALEATLCSFPDCGCDGARHCFTGNPNNAARGLNIEKGDVSGFIHRGKEEKS